MGGQTEQRGWYDDDFLDVASSEPLSEHDPWDVDESATSPPGLPPMQANHESPIPSNRGAGGGSPWDFVDELAPVDPGDRWPEESADPPTDWAEPDPTIDASSELSESLYPADGSITDITRDLKIGNCLSTSSRSLKSNAIGATSC